MSPTCMPLTELAVFVSPGFLYFIDRLFLGTGLLAAVFFAAGFDAFFARDEVNFTLSALVFVLVCFLTVRPITTPFIIFSDKLVGYATTPAMMYYMCNNIC